MLQTMRARKQGSGSGKIVSVSVVVSADDTHGAGRPGLLAIRRQRLAKLKEGEFVVVVNKHDVLALRRELNADRSSVQRQGLNRFRF